GSVAVRARIAGGIALGRRRAPGLLCRQEARSRVVHGNQWTLLGVGARVRACRLGFSVLGVSILPARATAESEADPGRQLDLLAPGRLDCLAQFLAWRRHSSDRDESDQGPGRSAIPEWVRAERALGHVCMGCSCA